MWSEFVPIKYTRTLLYCQHLFLMVVEMTKTKPNRFLNICNFMLSTTGLFSFKNNRLIDFIVSLYCRSKSTQHALLACFGLSGRNPTGSHCHTKIVGFRFALPINQRCECAVGIQPNQRHMPVGICRVST